MQAAALQYLVVGKNRILLNENFDSLKGVNHYNLHFLLLNRAKLETEYSTAAFSGAMGEDPALRISALVRRLAFGLLTFL